MGNKNIATKLILIAKKILGETDTGEPCAGNPLSQFN